LAFAASQVGVLRSPLQFTVTRAQIEAYATAINDESSEHRSGEVAGPALGSAAGRSWTP
jgi:hypothetical protein